MFYVDGISFNSKPEYEKALKDKEIIDSIVKRYDLKTESGIKEAYKEVKNCHFNTVIGDRFDDRIYELYSDLKINPEKYRMPEKGKKVKDNKSKKNTGTDLKKNAGASKKDIKDLDAETKKKIAKEIKKQNLRRDLLIAVFLIFGFASIGYFAKYYYDAKNVQDTIDEFTELKDEKYKEILTNVTPVVKKDYEEDIVIPDILDEYLALYNKNKSLIGWIKIADTIIDYPVMQTTDNEYYLKHNFNQDNDANGCIFLDYNCDVILGNDNFIIYGHHMKNGKMFSTLDKFENRDFYENHKTIQFDTIYEKGTYEVMYIFRSHIYNTDEIAFKYYQFIDANSEEEFDSYMEEMAKLSLIDTGVSASYGDRLITLSTCDYQEANGRFVVVAKKIN